MDLFLMITSALIKNLTAPEALKNSIVKQIEHREVLNVAPVHDFNLLYVDRNIPLEQNINLYFKRAFDLIVSTVLLICIFSWLFPLISLLIKLDSKGPIFFFQKRNKKNGNLFTCIKFRTMIVNDAADTLPAVENDIRITRIGAFLRKHHLDELPQLFNVLSGDMSMIGPRPYMVNDNDRYEKVIKNYLVRHKIKPGITGLAQVINYVAPVATIEYMEERVNKDVYYVYNWSPVLDAKIIFYTLFKMAGKKIAV
jgi:lipopolysaccharide/colanic/teichoic acid biosynthesis glycosyltransferase